MKTGLAFILALVLLSSVAFAQNPPVILPLSAHNAGEAAGYFIDPATGNHVYRLGDTTLCPNAADFFYSYYNEFSPSGYMTFTCHTINSNVRTFPVYDSNFNLVYKDAQVAAGNYNGGSASDGAQWSQTRDVLFVISGGAKIAELNPFAGTNRIYADFMANVKSVTMPNGSVIFTSAIKTFSVGPRDQIMVHLQCQTAGNPNCPGNFAIIGVATYDPSNNQYYAVYVPYPPGAYGVSGFDEAQFTQNPAGRVTFVYGQAPNYVSDITMASVVQYDDNHGHRGYFCGSNGRCYKVSVVNNKLANGGVGQIGCTTNGIWHSEDGLYNDVTGKREYIWGCTPPSSYNFSWSGDHFSRSMATDVFYGSGTAITKYTIGYDALGNPNSVSGLNVAYSRSNISSCGGYTGNPRVVSDYTGNRAMFMSIPTSTVYPTLENNGNSITGCRTETLVAVAGGTGTGPPPPRTTPPVISNGAPSGALSAGTVSTTISVMTDEAATCKYSTTANTAYASMANTFTTTGSFSHSSAISGLANGGSYNYYVRCIDASGNVNTADYVISFSVNTVSNIAQPVSDVTTGWTGSTPPYWSNIDGLAPGSTSIRTGLATGVENAEVLLSPVLVPSVKTGHIVHVTAMTDGTGNTLTYELRQGSTVIASGPVSMSIWTSPATLPITNNITLTTAQASQITNYNDLRIHLTANAVQNRITVYWVMFEVPNSTQAPPADTTPPTVSISSPAGGTQSGTITVTATASDNVAVAGVQFMVDGSNIGTEVTAPPYSVSLDTTTLTNGNHILAAIARDTSNNLATSAGVTINVNNLVTPPPLTCGGTPANTCLSTKPQYCDSTGTVVNKCSVCTCPTGYMCQPSEACAAQTGAYTKLTIRGRLLKNTASQVACSACSITIGLLGVSNTTTTAADGTFVLDLYKAVSPGNYIFDINVNDGTNNYVFKRRGTIV